MDELLVTLSSLISHTGQMGVPLLAVLAHHTAVIEGVFSEEALRVVVAVDVNLSQSIMGSRFLTALVNASLQPRQKQLQSVIQIKTVNFGPTAKSDQRPYKCTLHSKVWGSVILFTVFLIKSLMISKAKFICSVRRLAAQNFGIEIYI